MRDKLELRTDQLAPVNFYNAVLYTQYVIWHFLTKISKPLPENDVD